MRLDTKLCRTGGMRSMASMVSLLKRTSRRGTPGFRSSCESGAARREWGQSWVRLWLCFMAESVQMCRYDMF